MNSGDDFQYLWINEMSKAGAPYVLELVRTVAAQR